VTERENHPTKSPCASTSRRETAFPRARLLRLLGLLFVCSSLTLACEQAPSAESLKEWSSSDHHSSDDDKVASGAQAPNSGARNSGGGDTAQLVDLTWRRQCSSCHGPMGKGDGQMGPMVQAPDLTREDWQGKVTDADMAATIRSGKNKMPKFDLPDPVLKGLVARIRAVRGR
jgi:cbb3-type cytochrome c oxidase subunit III